ncbi:MAG: response regulator [Oscillibacter sp.]|nr:response regulator [Oscillibacter sp.]
MKILIVDDEKMIRNWLTMLLRQIPDRTFEISAVSNVDDALDHCSSHEVHLVITDITMPQRSGLELLQILRESYPKVCAAVLSAYDDYQYIRTAMQLGAIDYILKAEMELSDLLAVIRKVELFSNNTLSAAPAAKGTLAKSNDYNLSDFLDDRDSLAAFLSDVNPELEDKNLIVYVFSLEDGAGVRPAQILDVCNKTLSSESLAGSTFQLQSAYWVICNTSHVILEHQKEQQQRLSLLLERNILTLVQKNIHSEAVFAAAGFEALRTELKRQLSLLQCRQYYPDAPQSTVFHPMDREELGHIIKKLRFLLEIRRYADAADFLLQSLESFHAGHVQPEDLKTALHHCITIIFLNTTALQGNLVFASHYQDINRQMNLATTEQSVAALTREVCALYKEELKDSRRTLVNPSLKRVIEYIDQNYMHRLTLENVAQHVFLNKTYISQMFMKHLGISFVSYLESVRIYKAQELLQNTDMSVTKIAEETGYASQSYFTKAFKKRVGMSPLQYRSVSLTDRIQP